VRDDLARVPYTVKVLLENVLRNCGRGFVTEDDVRYLVTWSPNSGLTEGGAVPAGRVVMQDITGVRASSTRGDARRDERARRDPA